MNFNDNSMSADQDLNLDIDDFDDYEEELYNYEEDNGDDNEEDVEEEPEGPRIQEAINIAAETADMQIDPVMVEYIGNIRHQIILLGKCDISNPRTHGNILARGLLSEKQINLYKFINTVLQSPACVKRCETWWAANTIRNYRYAIRDYVTFMAEAKIDGRDVDETNFEVDGIHVVKCMENLIQISYQKAGGPISGFNRKLLTFKRALEGLQHLIALYKSCQVADERERERQLCKAEKVENLHLVRKYIQERRKISRELQSSNFDDKDRDNMFSDRYSHPDLKKMVTHMWSRTGSGQKKEAFEGINAALELLVGHHLLFRGDNKRTLELSDSTYTVQETSRGEIPILGFQLSHSKTSGPDGRPLCMGACRSKDVQACMISSVAFSLWYRFDFKGGSLTGGNFPKFLDKKSWYPIKLLFSTKTVASNKPISYNHENTLIKKCLSVIGLVSKKTTHLSRKSNAQSADANQINEEQIMRAGNLMTSNLIKYYLSPYPFDFILQTAGFKADEPYFISRDVEPPIELKKMIFPWLEEWIEKVNNRPDQRELDPRERDGVVPKFLDMLNSFRSIIVQDLAVWMDIAPDSIYCQHEITRHPSFATFRETLRRRTDERNIYIDLSRNFNDLLQICHPFVQVAKKLKIAIERGVEMHKAALDGLASKIDVMIELMNRREMRYDEQIEKYEEMMSRQLRVEHLLEQLSHDQNRARDSFLVVSSQITELNLSLRGTTMSVSAPYIASAGMSSGITSTAVPPVTQEIMQQVNNNVLNRTSEQVMAPPIFNPEDPRYALKNKQDHNGGT